MSDRDVSEYKPLDCKPWQASHGIKPVTDTQEYKFWCCSECHYFKHNEHAVRRGPHLKGIYFVCCSMSKLCIKKLTCNCSESGVCWKHLKDQKGPKNNPMSLKI